MLIYTTPLSDIPKLNHSSVKKQNLQPELIGQLASDEVRSQASDSHLEEFASEPAMLDLAV